MENSKKARALEFTLALGCSLQCKYCPQEKLQKAYRLHKVRKMSMDTFKRCLSQIELGGGVIISGMVEPFHNENCAEMIKYAFDNGYKVRLFTSLTGVTEKDLDILEKISFDELTIHILDQKFNSKFRLTKEYLNIFEQTMKRLGNQISAYSVHGEIHESVKDMLLKDKVITSSMFDRAGNLEYEELPKTKPKGRIRCMAGSATNIGIWTPEVLPDGTVTLCCMDYGMQHVLGNLVRQEWKEIAEGEEYQKILKGFEDDSINNLCRSCSGAREEKNWPSSMVKKIIEQYNEKGVLPKKNAEKWREYIEAIANAKHIAVFGMGRLFYDQYFYGAWDEVMQAEVFSDNNSNMWGQEIQGIPCVNPEKLKEYEDLLVVVFVKNDMEIGEQLKKMNIKTIIPIMNIYSIL